MDTDRKIRDNARRRRRLLQQGLSASQNDKSSIDGNSSMFQNGATFSDSEETHTSRLDAANFEELQIETTLPEGQIQTTVEMVSEIPENVKLKLKMKRKKMKELKKTSLASKETSFILETIEKDIEDDASLSKENEAERRPRTLPKIPFETMSHSSGGMFSGFREDSIDDSSSDLRKLIPPQRSKKSHKLKKIQTQNVDTELSKKAPVAPKRHNHKKKKQPVPKGILTQPFYEDDPLKQEQEAPEEEAYDFFTRVWEPEPESRSLQSSLTNAQAEKEDFEEVVHEESDSMGLLRNELLQNFELYITEHEKPSYTPFQVKIEKENKYYFYPSSSSVPTKLKLAEKENSTESTEQIYKRPEVSSRNMNTLENRLLALKAFQWFENDGLLKSLPDPVCENAVRQMSLEKTELFPEITYEKATIDSDKSKLKEVNNRRYQLDLDISSITFFHHSLFCKEQVIESRLFQMYEKWKTTGKNDLVTSLKKKLRTLRAAKADLKKSMQSGMNETVIDNERVVQLRKIQRDLKQTKKLRDLKEFEQKSLFENLNRMWNELKACRDEQSFTSTSTQLVVRKKNVDDAAEKEEWERELLEELDEEMEEYESQYESSIKDYEEAMEKWHQWNKAQKQAFKRQKLREKILKESKSEEESETNEDLASMESEDEKLLADMEVPKPKSIPKFNSELTMERLNKNALEMRKHPGDPKIFISIDHTVAITPLDQCPKSEVLRRSNVSKCKIFFKLYYNDKKVSETTGRNLNQNFKAIWGEIFKLQIVHYPQSLRIEVYEGGTWLGTRIAELYIPIPTPTQTALDAKLLDHQFSSDKTIDASNSSIGSGVRFKFINGDDTWLLTNGSLRCSFSWGVTDDGTVMIPENIKSPSKNFGTLSSLPSHVISGQFSSIEEIQEWIQESSSNSDDINNADKELILNYLHEYEVDDDLSTTESSEFFKLEKFQEELDFAGMEEIESNKRFQLLQLRSRDLADFRDLQIPADEKDISSDMLEVQRSKSVNGEEKKSRKPDAQRDQAKQIMHKVREEVAKRFYVSQHQKTLEDVVIEEKVPNIGTIGFSLLKVFQTKRPLYPVRKDRKKVTGQTVSNAEVKIIVTVLHATNVPVRTDVDPIKEKIKQKSPSKIETTISFESQVQPFVEVMFQRVAVKTSVADGPHPTWNQELHLPFRAPNDVYSPASLETVKDIIYFNIFDEVTVDLLEDDKDRESVVHERLERRWLGNLKIPFTTLYLNSKIEGTFRINVPPVLLSYENEPQPWLQGKGESPANHTYLSLFMTIEPCLQLPDVFRDKCDSGEPEKVLYEVDKWHQTVIPRYPGRIIKLMTVDLNGKWIFISRYLRPLAPPEELLLEGGKDSLQTMKLLVRFVSLIPTVSDSIAFPGLCDIWSTSDQFLQMLAGDEEEHSILLCNYFLHLGRKAMVLLGSGIPEGPTAYVVTWEKNSDIWVWNASTGDYFNVRDNHNPLQRVGCLISPDNIWANIQRSDHPSRISFDLSKTGDWKPFFSHSFPNPGLKSIQLSSLTYTSTDMNFVESLQSTLKRSLQESIMKWRRRLCTSWNSYCNQVLYKILTRLERNAGRTASVDSLQELEQILSSHKMSGFPLTMPYTDNEAVIEAVFATGVHLNEDQNAEFSLAVHVHPYPCSIIAVWVYVAVLVSRRGPNID